jgi:large subunit ribosomal protein L24
MANRKKIHVKKGDTVMVLSGDDKGKTGRVLAVYPTDNRALVEGLNMVTKHRKPTAQNTGGKIDKIEAPMHISKLMVMVGNAPSRIGRKLDENGKLQRYSKKSGEIIK